VYVTKLSHHCAKTFRLLRCVRHYHRANTVRSVATYFAYSLVQTCAFTTHEASCNVKTDL